MYHLKKAVVILLLFASEKKKEENCFSSSFFVAKKPQKKMFIFFKIQFIGWSNSMLQWGRSSESVQNTNWVQSISVLLCRFYVSPYKTNKIKHAYDV